MSQAGPGSVPRLDPTNGTSVRRFLKAIEFRPSKRLGQNFLVDKRYLAGIVAASGLSPDEHCLEIGPGLGAMTGVLALNARSVIAVEIDHRLIEILRESFAHNPAVIIIGGDFLKLDLGELLDRVEGPVRVVANIPYSITSPLLEMLLKHKDRLSGIALLVQREVADRLRAPVGSSDYSSFTVFCQYHAEVNVALTIPRSAFVPTPNVDSSLIVLRPRQSPLDQRQEEALFKVVRAAFQQRRKMIANSLSDNLPHSKQVITAALESAGVAPSERAEDLTLDQYIRLSSNLPAEA